MNSSTVDRPVTLERLREMKPAIGRSAHEHGVTSIRVFGSVLRGNGTPVSDIDLLVEMEPHRDIFDLAGFKVDLEDLFGLRVDVVTPRALHPLMRERILADAQPL